jgi:hypothetical protein
VGLCALGLRAVTTRRGPWVLGGGRAEAEAEVLALTRLVERKLAAAPLGACVVLCFLG